jgi:biotin operon repressor
MPKTATAKKKPERQRRERGSAAVRAITTVRLLLEGPRTKTELRDRFSCGYSTIDRLFQDIEDAGLKIETERSPPKLDELGEPKYGRVVVNKHGRRQYLPATGGQRVFCRLDPEAVRKRLDSGRKRTADSTAAQLLDAIHLLEGQKRTPGELAKLLDCSRRTVERLVHALTAAGFTLESERSGREVFYSLSREVVSKVLGM